MATDTAKIPVVVLGAGVGGLAAGWFLARTGKYDVTVLERAPVIGGLCATFEHDGFMLDYGPHKMYSVIPGVLDEMRALMAGKLIEHKKRHRIYLRGHALNYPLQMGNLAKVLGPAQFVRLGLGYAMAMAGGLAGRSEPQSYAEYVIQRFGRQVYELVFAPLAWKVWGDPATLHPDMARTRIPSSGATELILNLLRIKRATGDTDATYFYYPREGFGALPQAMADEIVKHGGRVLTNARITGFDMTGRHVNAVKVTVNDEAMSLPSNCVVSSLPLPVIGQLVFGQQDPELLRAASSLKFRHLVLVYLFIKRPNVMQDHWVFFPEREYLFSRVFEQKVLSPEMGPADRTALCCDFTCSEGDEIWTSTDESLVARCIAALVKQGTISADEVTGSLVKRSENFYPVYDLTYTQNTKKVSDRLRTVDNLLTTGRIGMYNYNNSDHCVDMGRFIAQHLEQGEPTAEIWQQLEQRVAAYRIVD